MRKIKYFIAPILCLSLFTFVGCKEKKDNDVSNGEITFEELKEAFDNREVVNFNHCEFKSFYGYMDSLRDRNEDGTPILEEASLDYLYNEEFEKYKWTDEAGDTGYTLNGSGTNMHVFNVETIESIKNASKEEAYNIKLKKDDDNFIIIFKANETGSHIYNYENQTIYPVTINLTLNKYFYTTDYLKTVDKLMEFRVHDNKTLWEEHLEWSIKE